MLAMGVSTGPKALHVFAVYIGRNDNAEYKVSRDRYAIYFCDRQTDFRKEPSVASILHVYRGSHSYNVVQTLPGQNVSTPEVGFIEGRRRELRWQDGA